MQMGIGTPKDARDAMYWFERAAEHGDKRAEARLRAASGNPDQQVCFSRSLCSYFGVLMESNVVISQSFLVR